MSAVPVEQALSQLDRLANVDKIINGLEIVLHQQRSRSVRSHYCARCPTGETQKKAIVVLHGDSLCLGHARSELLDYTHSG